MRYEPYEAPSFCIVLEGRCFLMNDDEEPRTLERGDFFLQFYTPAFSLVSDPGAPCKSISAAERDLRHGDPDGPADFRSFGGAFEIERANAALLGLLRERIHIRSAERDTNRFARVIDLIMDEVTADRVGRDTILKKLLEVLLVESLRSAGADRTPTPGVLAGLRDPSLAVALRAMHADVRRIWSVGELAHHVGMSRSAFAARFTAALGCPPMEYLARWRMSLAQDALVRGGRSLERIAGDIGYESASAFSTAFRKRFGCAPGGFARAQRGG